MISKNNYSCVTFHRLEGKAPYAGVRVIVTFIITTTHKSCLACSLLIREWAFFIYKIKNVKNVYILRVFYTMSINTGLADGHF